ncbi:MAG TPA: hypothetical protein VGA01_20750 [Candidatus Binatia bacterium]
MPHDDDPDVSGAQPHHAADPSRLATFEISFDETSDRHLVFFGLTM